MHFFSVVIVPKVDDIDSAISKAFAPYDENRDVPEYEVAVDGSSIEQAREYYRKRQSDGDLQPGINLDDPTTFWDDWNGHKLIRKEDGTYAELTTWNSLSFWDWWQIGGRWTGALTGYDPETDPANVESCDICNGTGTRPDAARFGEEWMKQTNGCNACMGKGSRTAWPTQWKRHDGDIQPVSALLELNIDQLPHTLVTPDGVHFVERWTGDGFDRSDDDEWREVWKSELAKWPEHVGVVVDYHR